MQQTVFAHLPGLFGTGRNPLKTYAPSPVWKDSARGEVRFHPLPKREVFALYRKLKTWNRRKAAGRYGGSIGSACLRVFECLAFDFLNFRTGRLDPSYAAIAAKTGLGRSTVAEALKRLKALGVINWVRRCSTAPGGVTGRQGFRLEQDSNAYGICPASCWLGYTEPPTFTMEPHQWGAVPPLPSVAEQAIQVSREGGSITQVVRTLQLDPDNNSLAAALARLGESIARRSAPQITGVQSSD